MKGVFREFRKKNPRNIFQFAAAVTADAADDDVVVFANIITKWDENVVITP